jgi:hypothetical protein
MSALSTAHAEPNTTAPSCCCSAALLPCRPVVCCPAICCFTLLFVSLVAKGVHGSQCCLCCLLSVVRCLLFSLLPAAVGWGAVCCPPSDVALPPAVCRSRVLLLPAALLFCRSLPAVCCLLSTVCCLLSAVFCCLLLTVYLSLLLLHCLIVVHCLLVHHCSISSSFRSLVHCSPSCLVYLFTVSGLCLLSTVYCSLSTVHCSLVHRHRWCWCCQCWCCCWCLGNRAGKERVMLCCW